MTVELQEDSVLFTVTGDHSQVLLGTPEARSPPALWGSALLALPGSRGKLGFLTSSFWAILSADKRVLPLGCFHLQSPHPGVQCGGEQGRRAASSETEEDTTRLSCWNAVLCVLPHSQDTGNSRRNMMQDSFYFCP